MNKNYREWGNSPSSDSAFQNKLDQLRDLHDLETLMLKYATSNSFAYAPESVPKFAELPIPSQKPREESVLPIDQESILYNRSHFDHTLEYETSRALRYHRHLAICIVRIENLKGTHNSLRTQEVSRLIFRLARELKDMLRGIDIPARFDENSFAIILPETNGAGATAVAERIRSIFKASISKGLDFADPKFAIRPSIGCACFPSHAKTSDGLVDSALKSLETAASRGGDAVCML
jgi:diguanylate cyclase (GGDEF)-like protein